MGQLMGETKRSPRRSRRRSLRLVAAAVGLVTVGTALAGCGDSGENDASSGSGTTPQSEIDAAKEITEQNAQEVTSIGELEPLKAAPTENKLFVWMACDFPTCKFQTEGAEAAAEAAGWDFRAVNYSLGDPASGVAALKQALQYDPFAVGTVGFQKAQFASIIPAYEDAGVVLLNAYSDGEPTGPIISNYNGPNFCTDMGERFANWFIADSEGEGNGLYAEIGEVPCLKAQSDTAIKYVEEHCPGCSLEAVPVSIADAAGGKLASVITSALQRDKSLEYVIIPNAPFAAGLSAALAAAGLEDKVKVAAQGGAGADLSAMEQGEWAALSQTNIVMDGWRAVDGALRYEQGMEQPADDVLAPTRLFFPDTPDMEINDVLLEPTDYEEQFKELWQLN